MHRLICASHEKRAWRTQHIWRMVSSIISQLHDTFLLSQLNRVCELYCSSGKFSTVTCQNMRLLQWNISNMFVLPPKLKNNVTQDFDQPTSLFSQGGCCRTRLSSYRREEQSSLVALPHPLCHVGLRQGYYRRWWTLCCWSKGGGLMICLAWDTRQPWAMNHV